MSFRNISAWCIRNPVPPIVMFVLLLLAGIVSFNRMDLLRGCLTALREQTTPPDEIIVVDNDSTDDTVEVAASFGARVVTEPVRGVLRATAAGFDAASGEVIEVNEALQGEPAKVNADATGGGWFFKIRIADASELDQLMDRAAYKDYLASLS